MWTEAEIDGASAWTRAEPGAFENVVRGHMTEALALYLQDRVDEALRPDTPLHVFHDWLEAPTYDSSYRSSWMAWLKERSGIASVTFLADSKMLWMGIKVANIAYPAVDFHIFRQRPEYRVARSRFMADVGDPVSRTG